MCKFIQGCRLLICISLKKKKNCSFFFSLHEFGPEDQKLKIEIVSGEAWLDEDGDYCDSGTNNECDSYIKVFINDNHVYTTKIYEEKQIANIGETFVSEPTPKDSVLKFQMWDYDSVGSDDIMSEWTAKAEDESYTTNCRYFFGTHHKDVGHLNRRNKLEVCFEWV